MTKVSVIIPIYNREKYIEECLESVLSQTLKEIEIICVDDESTDDSYRILMDYKKKHNNILLLKQVHQGPGPARNLGIKHATGKYVCFMDSDDYYAGNQVLEKLYIKAEEKDALVCGGNMVTVSEDGDIRKTRFWFEKDEKVLFKEYGDFRCYTRFIFNLEMLRKNNIGFPSYKRFQDPPFLMRAMVCAESFYVIKEVIYVYRIGHKELKFTSEIVTDLFKGIRDCFEIAQKANIVKTYNDSLKDILKNYIHYIYVYRDKEEIWKSLNEINEISFNWMGVSSDVLLNKESIEEYVAEQREKRDIMLRKCRTEGEIVIYGAGKAGKYFLNRYGNECGHIVGFAVSNKSNENRIEGYKVKEIRDYNCQTLVIVAVGTEYADAILRYLEKLQFKNVWYMEFADLLMLDRIQKMEEELRK